MTPNTRPTLRRPRAATALAALVLALASGCTSARVYRQAQEEEVRGHWDLAVMAYEKAARLEPLNDRYRLSLLRARTRAAQVHYDRGRLHRAAGQLDLAAVEFEQAAALDSTNDSAIQELRRVKAEMEARRLDSIGGTPVEKAKARTRGMRGAPPMLTPSSTKPIDVAFPQDTNIKKIYQALGAASGINIIYDPQLKDDKFTLDLRGMTFQKALETAMRQANHFYKTIDEKTILIAQDTNQNRKEYEDLVIRTFFLSNGDVKDVSAMVRSILDLRRLGTIPQLNAIVIRDTADKVAVAERLIEVNDKAKSEVVVDVELLQINRNKILELGTTLSNYSTTASLATTTAAPGTSTGSTSTAVTTLPWKDILKLGLSDFVFTIPTVTFNFFKTNTDAELLAKPQMRISEGEKAQLIIGDRVPIPVTTVNTTQAIGQVGVVPVTSFQYQDVGIKIDIEPRVHHNKEVSLKLMIEVSNLNGSVAGPNGQAQPIIGTRTITSTIRLKDGETNFLAGLIRTDTQRVKTSIPFLGDLPLVGALFSDTRDETKRTDLFLTLTPHIIRSPQITEEDLTPIWVGTENNVSFSGLNTRLESPSATGSPFDSGTVNPAAGGRAVPPSNAPRNPFPAGGVMPGGAPNDPFRRPDPQPTPQAPVQKNPGGPSESSQAAPVKTEPVRVASSAPTLGLSVSSEEVAPGGATVVALNGVSGLADRGALEITVEWDPAVAEVTAVSPGRWRDTAGSEDVRFEADRGPGRAYIRLSRPEGTFGLPEGEIAALAVKAKGAGVALFRVSAGTSTGRGGPAAPVVGTAALTVGNPALVAEKREE
jgi:general secretion pathway protein D